MSEPVTPKANRRVIDAEVVESSTDSTHKDAHARRRAHNRAQQKQGTQSNASQTSQAASSSDTKTKAGRSFNLTWFGIWAASLVAVLLFVWMTRPDTDWQIEHINRLQTQVAQLHATNQKLVEQVEKQQVELEGRITEVLNRPENQPLVSQADIEALKQQSQVQLNQLYQQVQGDLQAQYQGFSQELEQRWQAWSQNLPVVESSTEEFSASLQQLDEKLQNRLQELSSGVTELFDFKQEQLSTNEANTGQLSQHEEQLKRVAPLNRYQLQQWMVEINTQWLVSGQVEQGRQQLMALEQALGISDLPNVTQLARLIGEDLNRLESYQQAQQTQDEAINRALSALQSWKASLPEMTVVSQRQAQVVSEATTADSGTSETESSETDALSTLMQKFSGLLSVKKRESVEDISAVEGLLVQDALQQRLTLLMERVQWAAQSHSVDTLKPALEDLEAFANQYFPQQAESLTPILQTLVEMEFTLRQPLAIVGVNEL